MSDIPFDESKKVLVEPLLDDVDFEQEMLVEMIDPSKVNVSIDEISER